MNQDGWKNTNDVVYEVAKRARVLTDGTMDYLRLEACSDPEGRISEARKEFRGTKKGELIEIILTEEFVEDFPRTVE